MAQQVTGLADYSSLKGVLANSKLAISNNSAYQVMRGLIDNASKSNDFLTTQFKDVNGNITSVQAGLQSSLDALSAVNGSVNAILATLTTIQTNITAMQANITTIFADLVTIAAIFADRNAAIYGASAYNSGSQTLTSGVTSVAALNTTVFDSGGLRSGNTFVAPASAQYLLSGEIAFAINGIGTRLVNVSISSGYTFNIAQIPGNAADQVVIPFSVLVQMNIGDSVQINITQDSGGNLAAQAGIQFLRVSYA